MAQGLLDCPVKPGNDNHYGTIWIPGSVLRTAPE
jgi:hypothetical protein